MTRMLDLIKRLTLRAVTHRAAVLKRLLVKRLPLFRRAADGLVISNASAKDIPEQAKAACDFMSQTSTCSMRLLV